VQLVYGGLFVEFGLKLVHDLSGRHVSSKLRPGIVCKLHCGTVLIVYGGDIDCCLHELPIGNGSLVDRGLVIGVVRRLSRRHLLYFGRIELLELRSGNLSSNVRTIELHKLYRGEILANYRCLAYLGVLKLWGRHVIVDNRRFEFI